MKAPFAKPQPVHPNALLLKNESRIAYDKLAAEYMELYKPANRAELDLVNDMICARWRLNRMLNLETAAVDLTMDRQRETVNQQLQDPDEATRAAIALTELAHNQALAIFGRHESRLRRTIERSARELERLRRNHKKIDKTNPANI